MDSSVASTLKEARDAKGLELSDIAEITNVRKEYLKALEEGRYSDLPEDIYSRNFLRLYAQALGINDSKILDQYTRERRSALGITQDDSQRVQEIIQSEPSSRRNPVGWILTLLLLAALGGLFYFAYSRNLLANLFRPGVTPVVTEPTLPDIAESTPDEVLETPVATSEELTSPETTNETSTLELDGPSSDTQTASESNSGLSQTIEESTSAETPSETALSETGQADSEAVDEVLSEPETIAEVETPDTSALTTTPVSEGALESSTATETSEVRFTLITDPPGADASIDNYPFASRTPVFNAPVTTREARVLRIELEGYETYEEMLDVLEDTSLSITLQPIGSEEVNTLSSETQTAALGPATSLTTQGQLRLQIEAETWLEVYQSTERGEGEQLYYGTAQTGEALSYNLPVYVHVGNAAGIRIVENGRDVGLMGSSGEVTGRSFGQAIPVIESPTETITNETIPDENVIDDTVTEPQTTETENE